MAPRPDERRVLLTHDDSYDENGEQVHADEKSVTKHVESNMNDEITWTAERTYRLFVKFFSHLAFKKRKTEQERNSATKGRTDAGSLLGRSPLMKGEGRENATHCQFVSGGGRSPMVVKVSVDQ